MVRVRWGQKPHRKANHLGKEFSAIPDQEKYNALALRVQQFENVMIDNVLDSSSVTQIVARYMYLTREQEWSEWPGDEHLKAHRTVPKSHPPVSSPVGGKRQRPEAAPSVCAVGGIPVVGPAGDQSMVGRMRLWRAPGFGSGGRNDLEPACCSVRPLSFHRFICRGAVEFGQARHFPRIIESIAWKREMIPIGHFWLDDVAVRMVERNQGDLVFVRVNHGVLEVE